MNAQATSMSMIVTGSSGFIGTHLCRSLAANVRARLIGVDQSPPPPSNSDTRPALADIRDRHQLLAIPVESPGPVLIHLAAKAEVVLPFHEYLDAMTTNVDGTVCVLEAFAPKVVIFASSSSVYGNTGTRPAKPIWARVRPLGAYGISKALGESICAAWAAETGSRVVVFRFGNVVGPGCRGLIPYLVQHALRYPDASVPARMRGNGRILRDYVPVQHVVEIIARAIAIDWPGGQPMSFNIGAGWGLTNKTVAGHVQDVLEQAGYGLRIHFDEAPAPGEAMSAVLDVSQTTAVFDVAPPAKDQVLRSIRDAALSHLRALTLPAAQENASR